MVTYVKSPSGDVKVANLPTRTTYYRGRYYRTETSVCVTPTNFRSFCRATYFGHSAGLRWWDTTGQRHDFYNMRYDSSRVDYSVKAPF